MEGSACLGYMDIHSRLKIFAEKLQHDRSPLYFVHVDITNSFDTILPRLLFTILKEKILTQPSYLLRRYSTVMLSNSTIKRSFLKSATTREMCEPFGNFVNNLSLHSSLRNAIITDMVTYPAVDRAQLLTILKCHLFRNIIRFKGQYYQQTQGIPQGSRISSLLCSFYYDQMVKDHLPDVKTDMQLLMHYVDDFLLITQDPDAAQRFLTTMTQGIPDYNCFVNIQKTATNFICQDNGKTEIDSKVNWFQWCGLLINTHTLEVKGDYSKYAGNEIRNNLTIVSHTRPFHNLHRFILQSVRLRCQAIFLDCELHSEKTVLVNTYQLFLLVAVKLHAAVGVFQLGRRRQRYTSFFIKIIQQSTNYFYHLARNRCQKSHGNQSSFTVPLEMCIWLGCHAYKRVLEWRDHSGQGQGKSGCGYRQLVKVLSSKLASVADSMALDQVKRCLRATTLADCEPIFRIKC